MADPDIFDSATADGRAENEVRRDQWGRYLLPVYLGERHTTPAVVDGGTVKRDGVWHLFDISRETSYTRATTLAKTLTDTYILNRWGKRMVAYGITQRPDLYAAIASLTLDDRDELDRLAEKAAEAAGAKSAATLGTAVHAFSHRIDRGEPLTIVPAAWRPDVESYAQLLDAAGLRVSPRHIERIVVAPQYGAAGTFDRFVQVSRRMTIRLYRDGQRVNHVIEPGTWVCLDLKTGRDLTYGWQEIAIQLRMYADAVAMWNLGSRELEPMPFPIDLDVAFVVHLPVGSGKAELHAVDIGTGEQGLALAQNVRLWRKTKNLAQPLVITPQAPDPTPAPTVPVVAETCGSIEVTGGTACALTGPHTVHSDGKGTRWPVGNIPDGQNCIICSRPAKAGKITHAKGCPDITRGRPATPAVAHIPVAPELQAMVGAVVALPDPEEKDNIHLTEDDLLRAVRLGPDDVVDDALRELESRPATPHTVDTRTMSQRAPVLVTVASWADQIRDATTAAELSRIYREASAIGQWTPRLAELGQAQHSKIRTI